MPRKVLSKIISEVDESFKEERGELITTIKTEKNQVVKVLCWLGFAFMAIFIVVLKALFPSDEEKKDEHS